MDDDVVRRAIDFGAAEAAAGALAADFDPHLSYTAKAGQVGDSPGSPTTRASNGESDGLRTLLTALQRRDATIERMGADTAEISRRLDLDVAHAREESELRLRGALEVNTALAAQVEALQYIVEHGSSSAEMEVHFAGRIAAAQDRCDCARRQLDGDVQAKCAHLEEVCEAHIQRVEAAAGESATVVDNLSSPERVNSCVEDVFRLARESHERKLSLLMDRINHQVETEVAAQCSLHFAFTGAYAPQFIREAVQSDICRPVAADLVGTLTPSLEQIFETTKAGAVEQALRRGREMIARTVRDQFEALQERRRNSRVKQLLMLCDKKESEYRSLLDSLHQTREANVVKRRSERQALEARVAALTTQIDHKKRMNEELRCALSTIADAKATFSFGVRVPVPQEGAQASQAEPRQTPPRQPSEPPTNPSPHPKRAPTPSARELMDQTAIRKMYGSIPPQPTTVQEVPRREAERLMAVLRQNGRDVIDRRLASSSRQKMAPMTASFSRTEAAVMQELRRLAHK